MKRISSKPNIVLITLESLRADFVGYQNPNEQNTPFLDKLASESFVYTEAIVPGMPTFFHFPSLMTGKLPFAYGHKLGIDSRKSNKTIAEVLRVNGYQTIAVLGDNPQLYSLYGFNRGFDIYQDGFDRTTQSDMFIINALWNIKQKVPGKLGEGIDYLRAAARILSKSAPPHIPGKELNKKIMKTLSDASGKPFFLWVHYMDIHFPYLDGINRIKGTLKKIIYYKKLVTSVKNMRIDDPEVVEQVKEAYRGCIKEMDEAFEQLYAEFETKYPNTIFIVTSDHGEAFMEHGMFCHEALSLYDELIRVPLLVHFPSKKKKVFKNVVSTVSIPKTICSLIDIPSGEFVGTDITKDEGDVLENHISKILYRCISPSIRFQIFDNETEIEGFHELVSYTNSEFKYIQEKDGDVEELYSMKDDRAEANNLVNSSGKKSLRDLRQKLVGI